MAAATIAVFALMLVAHAAPTGTGAEVDEAAAVLSRYPAGSMPPVGPVFDAIDVLGAGGSAEELPVLQSIAAGEDVPVARAAARAASLVRERTRAQQRENFALDTPTDDDVRAWLDREEGQVGSVGLGRTELTMVAYTSLLLEGVELAAAMPSAAAARSAALQAEDDGKPRLAVAHYGRALAAGDLAAADDLRSFGVDPERLLLGLTSIAAPMTRIGVPELSVEVLATDGSVHTVAVLVERSRGDDAGSRAIALDVLGRMLDRGQLPPGAAAAARRVVDVADRGDGLVAGP